MSCARLYMSCLNSSAKRNVIFLFHEYATIKCFSQGHRRGSLSLNLLSVHLLVYSTFIFPSVFSHPSTTYMFVFPSVSIHLPTPPSAHPDMLPSVHCHAVQVQTETSNTQNKNENTIEISIQHYWSIIIIVIYIIWNPKWLVTLSM